MGLQRDILLRLEAAKLIKKVFNAGLFVSIVHFLLQIVWNPVFMMLTPILIWASMFAMVSALAIFGL